MIEKDSPIRVTTLYRFTPIGDCEAVRIALERACDVAGVRGTLLLAHEGINGTIAGTAAAVDQVLAEIRSIPGCAGMQVKDSYAAAIPFHRMKVRIKREIVTMGQPDIDPLVGVGHYVAPEDWNDLISAPGTILIDTRNDYEVGIGTFENAIDPQTPSFRDFPAWFREQRASLVDDMETPRIAMFCTGGIRCEKATAFLKSEGIEEVFHLDGGILKYLEVVPPEQSLWRGECFVFDERVAVVHGLERGTHMLCRACRRPVSVEDRASALYEEGTSCPACHGERDGRQRAGYAERHVQARLAEKRGQKHVGAVQPGSGRSAPRDG